MKLVRKLRNNVAFNFLSQSAFNTNESTITTTTVDGNVGQTVTNNEYSSQNANEDTQSSKQDTMILALTHEESQSQFQSQSQSLSLMHLKKLFKEFLELYESLSKHEKREKLLNLLPLFCKVFGVRSNGDILEKFDDAANFCQHLTKLFIEEIQSRASNQKSGIASQILFDFLRIHKNNSKECNHGWLMLSSFFIFAYNHQTFIEIMIENSLPSTMVKCLYLFLDLPSNNYCNESDCKKSDSKTSQYNDITLFQSTFHKLLIKLCNCRFAAEDLIANDVLILLFHAITTWCSDENLIWRKCASDVLTTVSRYGLTLSVINNIHNKNSMSICIENLYHFMDINALEIVDMLLTLFCFLKDSCSLSPVLLEDFKNAKGYVFLEDFLLSLEQKYCNDESKVHDVMRHMIQRIACLVTYGYNDIKVTKESNSFMYKLPGFLLPKSRNDSTTVRNISAFKVLQSCFFKTKSVFLSCVILDSISNIFNSDYANYFLLENHRILPQLIECVHLKPDEVQIKIFALVEFLVFELKYIPFKEFISMVIFLRTHVFDVPKCGQFCMNTLIAIIAADPIFKKIFREVGLIEVCITCLQYFRDLIERNQSSDYEFRDKFFIWSCFGPTILNCVRLMLCNSEDNIEIFNKYSGSKLIQDFIQYDSYRIFALEVIHELIISSSKSEAEFTFLLNSLNNSYDNSIEVKNQILICLIFCLKDSHKVRIWFRKNDGFLNVLNILMQLDNYLIKEKINRDIVIALRNIFRTISIAMKDEPGNAKYFFTNFCVTSGFRNILKCLKCFSTNIEDNNNVIVNEKCSNEFQENCENQHYFRQIFFTIDPNNFHSEISFDLSIICVIFRLLRDLLLEKFKTISFESLLSILSSRAINKQFRIIDLNLEENDSENLIVHPGILIIMFELIISIKGHYNDVIDLKVFLSNEIKLLIRSERNQQIMCQNGFVDKILTLSECILTDECDPLHNIYQSILERLATQFCNSKDLRRFFRLGQPLFCLPIDSLEKTGGTVPLSRLKSLVSMSTPKDLLQSTFMSNSSSFIEFNMSINGFAALFFPSLAPQIQFSSNVLTAAVSDSTTILLGNGSGLAVRMFPPQIGFSFSTWFYIEKFSDKNLDSHPVRLLNIFKTTNSKQSSESHICFSVFLSCEEKEIVISTLELNMSEEKNLDFLTPNEYLIRVPYTDIREKMWHHLVVVLNRSVLRNSTLFLYLNGELIHSQSIIYMCQTHMYNTNNSNISLFAYIGTPYDWRKVSSLCWRQGYSFLFEEVLLAPTVLLIYKLGSNYIGSLQAVRDDNNEHDLSLVTEEKISFGINPLVETEMNLSKIKKIYNRVDYKTIVKHLNLATNDHLLTVRILHNTAAHLPGPIRTLGGVTIGYLSCRIFKPQPMTNEINSIGGSVVLLGLIAMSQNADSLYAAVKSLVCIVKANYTIQQEMEKNNYYQMLSMLLQRKSKMLNSHVLNLILSLVGTNDIGRESPIIPNKLAFQNLLCNFEIWNNSSHDLLKSLFENIYEIVILEKNEIRRNLQLMRDMKMVEKIIYLITHLKIKDDTLNIIYAILIILLGNDPIPNDLLNFGQFIVSLLLDKVHINELNWCLKIIYSILIQVNENTIVAKSVMCEEFIQILGFDWILLFFNQGLNNSTVITAMKILLVILSIPNLLVKFRENEHNKCWTNISKFKSPIGLLPTSIDSTIQQSTQFKNSNSYINNSTDNLSIANFDYLNLLLIKHINLIEIYPLLLNLIMGQTAGQNQLSNLDLDQVWNYLNIDSKRDQIRICPEAIAILLTMTQFLINSSSDFKKNSFFIEQPIAIIQLLFAFYQKIPDFSNIFMTTSLVTNLSKILFPLNSTNNYTKLIDHPVYFHVINFIKIIIIDSFNISINNNNNKNIPIIDLVLNVTCDDEAKSIIDITQNIEYNKYEIIYQNEILSTIIDHLLTNMCLNDNNSIANVLIQNENRQNVFTNICYLNTRIVDKLWQKRLRKDFLDIFYYNIRLIDDLKRKSNNYALYLDNLCHSLNRTILFLVSRPYQTQDEQRTMLENLEKLRKYEIVVFHGNNDEIEFFACLIYCLLHLINHKEVSLDLADLKNYTVWHISNDDLNKNELNENISQLAMNILKQIYSLKKVLIDDIFKVNSLSMLTNQEFYVEDQVYEIALKYWQNFLESEKKAAMYKYPYEYYQKDKFNLKLNRVVSGGLNRLANRSKSKKDEQMQKKYLQITESKIDECIMANVKLVQDFVHNRRNYYQIEMHYTHKYLYNIWLDIESDLIRERGLWGPETPNLYDKWLLDLIEGSCRMRKKLIRNHSFYLNYPYMPDQNHTSLKYRYATSFDSKNYYEALKAYQMQNLRNSIESIQNFQEDSLISVSNNSILTYNSQMSSLQTDCFDDYFDDLNLDDNDEMSSIMLNNQFLLRLLEPNERISFIFRCLRIEGLDHVEGLLIFGKECCYIIDGFTILKNREIRDIDNLSTAHKFYEPILPESSTISGIITNQKNVKKCAKIFYEDIREVLKRRYLLQPMALEMFSSDGRNYLLAFPRNIRNEIYQKFKSFSHSSSINSSQDSVSGQKRNINIEQVSNIFTTFMGETVVQRWIRGEISNFQYLMHLNSLAGRSYNDLMQYPIFPWILSDYESEELDLTNPNSFRDLKRPMGAQTSERLEQFCKRYVEWDDPYGETPPYHYGTHYSSAMIVCSYLVRLEPFTQQFLRLQGGHFDLADRMFHSVEEAWLSASKNNMADVKELIPEFFYLPEFLINSNNFDFGIKQNGVQLNDVILPPWAKNDPYEFIRLHRMALESDYVSQNLHHWIDLIFGYKQQGQMAIDSFNLFHHLFYEGNVDIYNIDDPLKKIATIGFINNFGQIPKQLFHKPHSAKKTMRNITLRSSSILDNSYSNSSNLLVNEKVFYKSIDNLKPSAQPIKELKGSVGQIIPYEKTVLAVEENKCFIPPAFNKYLSWGYADHSLRISNYDNGKNVLVHEMSPQYNEEIMVCACPNSKTIITAGSGCYVSVYKYELKKRLILKRNLFGHTECIVCLAANTSFNIIVSGSKDCTAIIWDLSRLTFIRQLLGHISSIAAISIQENTGNIATCSGTWLYIWNINGFKLASIDTSIGKEIRMQQILCVSFSYYNDWDTDNVIITGSTDGIVKMWSMCLMKQSEFDSDHKIDVHWKRKLFFRSHLTMYTAYSRKDNTEPASITALAISKDHKMIYVGDSRGRIYSWTLSETPGRSVADHWCRNEGVEFCVDCQIRFTIYERKHHCRSCGLVFCSKCTSYESKILRLNIFSDVRVCHKCFRSLNESHD